jgi:hypothetical protein
MTETPVLTAGQTRDLLLDGTRYTIRALTHGQHAALQVALAAHRAPSTEMINDALRQVAEREGRPDLAEALTAEEEAGDALQVFRAAMPPALDEEGVTRWEAENAAELARLRSAVLAAARRARLAREAFAGAKEVADLTRRAAEALSVTDQLVAAAGLAAIDGRDVALTAGQVAALPSAHLVPIAQAVAALLTPSRDAAKN